MDFSKPFPLDPLPADWYHRTFWTRGPMQMAFAVRDGVPALRFETRSTASLLFRHVDLDLMDYRFLVWRWYIEQPIESPLDEQTREGDDQPARLFLVFQTATGKERRREIIWGSKLKAGDYKYTAGFPHYVADGGDENIRQWRGEEVDLQAVYRHIWPDDAPAHLIDIAIFCDSDDTRGPHHQLFCRCEDATVSRRAAGGRVPRGFRLTAVSGYIAGSAEGSACATRKPRSTMASRMPSGSTIPTR